MLLNLSNHPSTLWSEKQLGAAAVYGKIIDLPFPDIDPYINSAAVFQLAHTYLAKILEQKPTVVHIMGEMTFVCALVPLLQQNNIKCLASTTIRKVTVNEEMKTSQFEFVQFRPYHHE